MTTMQILSLVAIAVAAVWSYVPIPSLDLFKPRTTSALMNAVSQVVSIRDETTNAGVRDACTTLLKKLLEAQ